MPDLAAVFAELRTVLAPYAETLHATRDTDTELYVDTRALQANGKPQFFGAVQLKKGAVRFHLMPVYVRPELLEAASDALRKRMQGKSCFAFSAVEPALFQELDALTRAGFESYREQGLV